MSQKVTRKITLKKRKYKMAKRKGKENHQMMITPLTIGNIQIFKLTFFPSSLYIVKNNKLIFWQDILLRL
jgi:hypothetical protein